MAPVALSSFSAQLLTQRGLAVVPAGDGPAPEPAIRAVELEWANLGYVASTRLRQRLGLCSVPQLTEIRSWTVAALLAHLGGDQPHEPLFRRFPEGIPDDTEELWWRKVLVHFLQQEGQPCLFCRNTGTTHVLNPCRHVVCENCFDGANYSACPVCEQHVERTSAFFRPTEIIPATPAKVTFKLIDLAESPLAEAHRWFLALAERTQPLAPQDRDALQFILREWKAAVLNWLPPKIPVRENVALILGTLFQELEVDSVLPLASRYLTTATDVLRFIAVLSGTDGSLLPETILQTVDVPPEKVQQRFWAQIAQFLGAMPPQWAPRQLTIPLSVYRFKMVRMPRRLRRAILGLLAKFDADRLVEDMLRHRSYWVWVGEFLHPHEYAQRFPTVARAFQIVRKKSADGVPAPPFRTWNSRVETALRDADVPQALTVLAERPGEFARRLDHVLCIAAANPAHTELVLDRFVSIIPQLPNPLLLTLASYFVTRNKPAPVRVYWPKGRVALGPSSTDTRLVLSEQATSTIVSQNQAELLRRFSKKPPFVDGVIDESLRQVVVPFNERTATKAAVYLPRGSSLAVPDEKHVRMFLHWCESPGGPTTDLDLSIALYDDHWRFQGTCSYYQLKLTNAAGQLVAQSAGDLRSAPRPDGATEFVDLHRKEALAAGARYAVMVINAYAGQPFSKLERGFAGLMFRDSPAGSHFDPLTVKLRFNLDGANGVYLPLVLDLQENMLHWLDIQTKGQLAMNNVATSDRDISRVCPNLLAYFSSGVRTSMFDLALLHAAARCERVTLRGDVCRRYVRRTAESPSEFFQRMQQGAAADEQLSEVIFEQLVFGALYQGDQDFPAGSSLYALFHERTQPSLAASDLLS